MKNKAVPQLGKFRFGSFSLSLAVVGLMSFALAGSAIAASGIGKDGKVHACYRVKGKAKGSMRVVPAKKKCRRGERKLAWSIAGSTVPAGSNGTAGGSGSTGDGGSTGAAGSQGTSNETALQAKISNLTLKLEGLEGVLEGITNGDLTGAVGKLGGLSGLQLTEAVDTLPAVGSLCSQATALTTRVGVVQQGLGGLSLNPVLTTLGGVLTVPSLPAPLTAYSCPS